MATSNYDLLLEVVNTLKYSQGFYSRLARQLNEMTEVEKDDLKEGLNSLPQWKDRIDCILYLEQ